MAADSAYPLPPRPRGRQLLISAPALGTRWSAGLRAAVAFGAPALVCTALGYPHEALSVILGAFAVLYGENRPYRVRGRAVLIAGACLLVSATLGALVAHSDPATGREFHILEVALLSAIAVVGVFVVDAGRLGPPGSFFFVLVSAVGLLMARSGVSVAVIMSCTVIGVASSFVVSMAGMLRDPHKPERTAIAAACRAIDEYCAVRERGEPFGGVRYRAAEALWNGWAAGYDAGQNHEQMQTLLAAHRKFMGFREPVPDGAQEDGQAFQLGIPLPRPSLGFRFRRSLAMDSHAATTAVKTGVACVGSGGICVILDLGRPDWAIIGAVLILHQGLDRVYGTVRGVHRFVGTALGLVVFAGLHEAGLSGYALIVVLMLLQFLIELFIASNYAIAVAFITPLALLVGSAGHADSPIGPIVRDRFVETTLGVLVALIVLWAVLPRAYRRTFRWTRARVLTVACDLLHNLEADPAAPEVRALRRDLQFELIGSEKSGIDAAHNDRGWTERNWPVHAAANRLGQDLLAACWAAPGGRLPDPDQWESRLRRLA
ncbi:FUSC family protein [Antrihabitans sp. YC2-6]|uniref:FUSC family protein n=1 Tax=Antrihabitans sp. YC2-6 TaxID=2799498 RepID=UPI0018F7CD79|nr:FUSC family protein [Antrihabitans sp. YC2-6]MBJ8348624.1 FUSC family protein [Antrihabitans sp. YC2-6]